MTNEQDKATPKPCPFCGKQPEVINPIMPRKFIRCQNPSCDAALMNIWEDDWNDAYCWKSRDAWKKLALEYRKALILLIKATELGVGNNRPATLEDVKLAIDTIIQCKEALALPLPEDQEKK